VRKREFGGVDTFNVKGISIQEVSLFLGTFMDTSKGAFGM
jgi:hypothetical protein